MAAVEILLNMRFKGQGPLAVPTRLGVLAREGKLQAAAHHELCRINVVCSKNTASKVLTAMGNGYLRRVKKRLWDNKKSRRTLLVGYDNYNKSTWEKLLSADKPFTRNTPNLTVVTSTLSGELQQSNCPANAPAKLFFTTPFRRTQTAS